ncbi:MAG TPA: response regulator transcription factor [Flavisolibacter sp.]|nr:response regulator transcription factor [Flavisolibacter sp.]
MRTPIRLLIAEDHALFRSSIVWMLKNLHPEIEVVGEAQNGNELVQKAEILSPDIILTDIQMPIMDGLAATKTISERFPNMHVIALSLLDEPQMVKAMREAGAKGYLLKHSNPEEMLTAIKEVHAGGSYFVAAVVPFLY